MSKEAKVGLIVLVAILAGIWGFNYLKGVNLFNKGKLNLYSVYDNVGGLTSSSPVTYKGLNIGKVNRIAIDTAEVQKLRVDFSITNDDILIPADSHAKIISSILGSASVEIILGSDINTVETNTELEGEIEADFTAAFKEELEPIKLKTEQLMEDVDKFLVILKGIIEDDASKSLPEAFESLRKSLKTLETSSKRVDGMIAENREDLKEGITQFKDLATTLTANSVNIDSILMNFRTVSADLAQTDISSTINNANGIIKQMAEITEKINSGQGSLGQLLNSDSLVVELQQSNQELQYLLNDLYTHPKKYVGFSIIGRKDRNGFSNKEEDEIKELIKEETN